MVQWRIPSIHTERNEAQSAENVVENETHAPTKGINDEESAAHQGFEVFKELLEKYSPKYHLHVHVHLNYGRKPRVTKYKNTVIINGYESYIFTYEE